MEETKTTTPAWIEEMHKWQEENEEQRAVLCIATDNGDSSNTLYGSNIKLTAALLALMIDNPSFVDICKGALEAKENPIAALGLIYALEESNKERDTSNKQDEEKPTDSSIKDSLKTILSKLADKL